MTIDLKLKVSKLAIYAIINSYTRKELIYHGGQCKLSKRLGYSREHINRAIKELVEDGLIIRTEKKKHPSRETSWILCQYKTVPLEELNLDKKENEEYYRPEYEIFDDSGFFA
jgi:predicted transcriptional regulator